MSFLITVLGWMTTDTLDFIITWWAMGSGIAFCLSPVFLLLGAR